jgi:predicted naringenin-chalcone synthase
MISPVYLSNFRSRQPSKRVAQKDALDWLASSMVKASGCVAGESFDSTLAKVKKYAPKEDQILARYTSLPEFANAQTHSSVTWSLDLADKAKIIESEMLQAICELLGELQTSNAFSHLLHVTCTGYASPSPGQLWLSQQAKPDLSSAPAVTHLYHMGCYAALPALRVAAGWAALGEETECVLTEFCSFHFDPRSERPENMVIHSLFADGACAFRVSDKRSPKSVQSPTGFRLLGLQETLVPDSQQEMTWRLGPSHFLMSLSARVPVLIRKKLQDNLEALTIKAGFDPALLKDPELFWAIHPGGPRIIQSVQEAFELKPQQVAHSLAVLRDRGNMSSVTLPTIWKTLLEGEVPGGSAAKEFTPLAAGARVITMGFGPGLTISSGLLEVV